MFWPAEVSHFRGVDAGDADVDLETRYIPVSHTLLLHIGGPCGKDMVCQRAHTVLSFNSSLLPGTFFLPGSQPQPASLPPGVWNKRKLSPSPTLVTVPNKLLFRQNPGEMLAA